jgi:hypothetical protein
MTTNIPEGFTAVHHDILADPAIGIAALGALLYLLSWPEDRPIRAMEIEQIHKCSRHRRRMAFRELIQAGYLVRDGRQWKLSPKARR